MLKRLALATALMIFPLAPAFAENGCDGFCREYRSNGRGHDRYDNHYDRHDRYRHVRHYEKPRTVVSFYSGYPSYYRSHYYRPTRVIYTPSPVVYAPQPQVIYINDSNSRQVSDNDGRYCREYQANAQVGGAYQQTYGTACMQPDGSWEIMS